MTSIYVWVYAIGIFSIPFFLHFLINFLIKNEIISLFLMIIPIGGFCWGAYYLERFIFWDFLVVIDNLAPIDALSKSEIMTSAIRGKLFIIMFAFYAFIFLIGSVESRFITPNAIFDLIALIPWAIFFLIMKITVFLFYLDMRSNQVIGAFIQGRDIDLYGTQQELYERFRDKYSNQVE